MKHNYFLLFCFLFSSSSYAQVTYEDKKDTIINGNAYIIAYRYHYIHEMENDTLIQSSGFVKVDSFYVIDRHEYIDERPYYEYKALVSQEGTNAPIIDEVANTSPYSFVYTRTSSGIYRITCTNCFIEAEHRPFFNINDSVVKASRINNNDYQLETEKDGNMKGHVIYFLFNKYL